MARSCLPSCSPAALAAPGETITLTLQAAKLGIVRLGGPDGRHTTTHACFADCREGRWGTLTLSPTGTDGTAFTGRYTLPLFLPDPRGPCARQVSTGFLAGQNGLLRSGDAGGHWGADRHRTLRVPLPTGKKRGGADPGRDRLNA